MASILGYSRGRYLTWRTWSRLFMPDLPTLPTHTSFRADLRRSSSSTSDGHALASSRYRHSVLLPPTARIRYPSPAARSWPRIPCELMVKREGPEIPGKRDRIGLKTMAVPGG